jgi:hypothetical protein
MKNDFIHKDRTRKEALEYYGKELVKKMEKTGLLDFITCRINDKKELVIYGQDWENAYHCVVTGKELFWD